MNSPLACRRATAAILSFAFGASFVLAQSPTGLPRPAPPEPSQAKPSALASLDLGRTSYRLPHDRLYVSNQADGSPQVRARTYKAEFTPNGATYIPFCGSEAPASHPLSFRIESITAGESPVEFDDSVVAAVQGTTVRYARGAVTEIYELALDSVEQKFVFDSLPASGALTVRLAVATGMSASQAGDALCFASDDGTVRYGAATAVDAKGARTPAVTELDGRGIAIRVPASFLARAAFPVTIDPVIATYYVGWNPEPVSSFSPALSWDETNQLYCLVYEETFSATDHDVLRVFVSPAGVALSGAYVDAGLTSYWAHPDVANNNYANNFLVVAEVGLPTGGTRTIHSRTVDAASGALGSDLLVSTADQTGEKVNPSVGGDPFLASWTDYAVVWQRINTPDVDEHIHGRLVTSGGALQGPGTLVVGALTSEVYRKPCISKSCQAQGLYHVVWERWFGGIPHDIYAVEMDYTGSLVWPYSQQIVAGPGGAPGSPACSPLDNNGRWLLVYEGTYTTEHDIKGALMSGITVVDTMNLSQEEGSLGSGTATRDQLHPSADTDGQHFVYGYSEQYGTSLFNYDVYVSTLGVVGNTLQLGEFHQALGTGSWREDKPRLCSHQCVGGAGNVVGVAWQYAGVGIADVYAGEYATGDFVKFCTPYFDNMPPCPCQNDPSWPGRGCDNSSYTGGAALFGSGNASLAADTVLLSTTGERPTALSMVTQGNLLLSTGTVFGQGLRCVGGPLKRLYVQAAVNGSIAAPAAGEPSIHSRSASLGDPLAPGSVRYYFVYYRDGYINGFCPSVPNYNATDALQVIWRW